MSNRSFVVALVAWWAAVALCAGCGYLLLGCAWDQPNPDIYTPTPDNPCGNVGVVCLDMTGKPAIVNGKHLCCDEGETCGGGKYSVGCPADECCNIRMPPAFMRYGDADVQSDATPTVVITKPQRHVP